MDVGNTREVLLSEVVIPPIITLPVVVGARADVIIEPIPEEPPVGTAVKLIPDVSVGDVGVTTDNVTEPVAVFKMLAIDERIPTSVVVEAELARAVETGTLTSLMIDDRTF